MKSKNVALIAVIALIAVSIFFLQQTKKIPRAEEKNYGDVLINFSSDVNSPIIQQKLKSYSRAHELVSPQGYFNTDNITISENIGKKVILVDFWTYTCINCQRTIPYLNAWYDKYKDKGFIIIGVHTPEFEFEKDYENVKSAIGKYEIKYPVVQDNDYETWKAYKNRFWPRKYLIDIDGFIVYDHIGEGGYEETERKIQTLLKERKERLNLTDEINSDVSNFNVNTPDFSKMLTPEIYFGYAFGRGQIGNNEGWKAGEVVSYSLPKERESGRFYLSGDWMNNDSYMELKGNKGSIYLNYSAKEVNLVAGSEKPVEISIFIDNKEIRNLTISNYELYKIYSADSYGEHELEVRASESLRTYTFTFG